jgi:hypothetical protein
MRVISLSVRQRVCLLGVSFSIAQNFFQSDNQTATSIPHNSHRPSSHSPKRLKSNPTFDLRPPDPGGPYQYISDDHPDNENSMPPKMRKRWMHRELESLRELNGTTSPSSSQGSNHNHIVRLSESPGSSSTSCVSLGSPTIAPTKMMESGLGISFIDGYGHSVFLPLSF